MNNFENPTSFSRKDDLGKNVESTGNYALATDDENEKDPDQRRSHFDSSDFFATFARTKGFQNFIYFLILLNCAIMVISTTDLVTEDPQLVTIFDTIDLIFVIIFTIELIFDFGAYGWGLFKSGWLTFDFLVVTLSWFFPTLQIMRGFRALRLMSRVTYIKMIFSALNSVLPVMGSIVVLLSVIFYVAAVIFSDLFGEMFNDGTVSYDYFGNLDHSLFSLFQVMTGAGWQEIAREIMITYTWAWIPFVIFITITMFVVVELTIAAMCKSVSMMEMSDAAHVATTNNGDLRNSQRMLELQEKIDYLNESIMDAVDNCPNNISSKDAGKGAASNHRPDMRPQFFSWKQKPSQEWYDQLSLSFPDHEEKKSMDEEEKRLIEDSYNCFPEFIQSTCESIVTNELIQNAIIWMIIINSITMGLATYDFIKNDGDLIEVFTLVDFVFLIVFTIELCIQFGYRGLGFFLSSWPVFDLVVISLSWILPKVQVARAIR